MGTELEGCSSAKTKAYDIGKALAIEETSDVALYNSVQTKPRQRWRQTPLHGGSLCPWLEVLFPSLGRGKKDKTWLFRHVAGVSSWSAQCCREQSTTANTCQVQGHLGLPWSAILTVVLLVSRQLDRKAHVHAHQYNVLEHIMQQIYWYSTEQMFCCKPPQTRLWLRHWAETPLEAESSRKTLEVC